MATPFLQKTQAEKQADFEKWQEKRMKRAVEAPAKRIAIKRLREKYPDEYKAFYDEELAKIRGGASTGKSKRS
jgi:hypothetical protein